MVKSLGHEAGIAFRRIRGQRHMGDVFDAVIPLHRDGHARYEGEVADAIDTLATSAELQFEPDVVVVDHYGLTSSWERTARSLGKFVVAFDDVANRPHAADLVFELVPDGPEREPAPNQPGVLRIRGLQYLPIGHDFRMPPPDWNSPSRNILVSFGGWDPAGGTLVACEALEQIRVAEPRKLLTADVVVGPACRLGEDVRRFASSRPWLLVHSAVPSLAPLVRRSHHVICAAGNTLAEVVASGRAPVSVIVAENQRMLASHLSQALSVRVFNSPDDVDPESLASAVCASWDGVKNSVPSPIDTLGANRCIARVLQESGMSK